MDHADTSHNLLQAVATKAVIIHNDTILLLRQSGDPEVDGAGRYHPPGGIVEPGESLEASLKREVAEETGLTIGMGKLVGITEGRVRMRGQDYQFFWIFYLCSIIGDGAVILQTSEASAFAWVGRDNFDSIDILEPARSLIKQELDGLARTGTSR